MLHTTTNAVLCVRVGTHLWTASILRKERSLLCVSRIITLRGGGEGREREGKEGEGEERRGRRGGGGEEGEERRGRRGGGGEGERRGREGGEKRK